MTDRAELFQTALDALPDGVVLFGTEGEVEFWNRAAQGITGYTAIELLARPVPDGLRPLIPGEEPHPASGLEYAPRDGRRALLHPSHKLGHPVPVLARVRILRDATGQRMGAAVVFHPAEGLEAQAHGEPAEDQSIEDSHADLEERLQANLEDFARGGPSFGVLWVRVDQARELRGTHGVGACQAMFDKVRLVLAHGIGPTEEMGRWDDEAFLIIAHQRSAEMLAAHAQTLAGLARTADFRWWGDRVSITVSIGAAQAQAGSGEALAQLLDRAQQAMEAGSHAGGNRATLAPGRRSCSPS